MSKRMAQVLAAAALLAPGPAGAQGPPVTLRLGSVDGKAVPGKGCTSKTGGGNFDLAQAFTVVFERPDVRAGMLYLQGRVVGLLRSPGKGDAGTSEACAAVTCDGKEGPVEVVTVCVPAHGVGAKDNLSVYRKEGPVCVPVAPGCYTLRQTFSIWAKGGFPGKPSAAEFAPGALNPAWISYKEPFYGATKRDFGFQVILKVGPAGQAGAGEPAGARLPDEARP